jgi:hypothetical protein
VSADRSQHCRLPLNREINAQTHLLPPKANDLSAIYMRYCIVKMDVGGVPEALVSYCQTIRQYIPESHDISKHKLGYF